MAVVFNHNTILAETLAAHVTRQRLLTDARIKGTHILLDRLTLAPGAALELTVAAGNLAWFQILDGETTLEHTQRKEHLTDAHIVFLPPGFKGTLHCQSSAALLYAEVPDAGRFDAGFAANPPAFRIVDWTREPVLDSEHDARRRIYVATPKLFGTRAIKGEMIIYPAGTEASNHHHEGAEHFMYVLKGSGTAWANENPFPVTAGDVIYYEDRERHYLKSGGDSDMVFVEFFVPGEYQTIWAPGAAICTWLPSGRNIKGDKPVREIRAHSSALVESPQDV